MERKRPDMQKRRSNRTIKRLETKFTLNNTSYTGITSDLSEHGIFVRTKKGFPPGTKLELEIYLPSKEIIKMHGEVKRTIKTPFRDIKNGMGVELTDPPQKYLEFLKTIP